MPLLCSSQTFWDGKWVWVLSFLLFLFFISHALLMWVIFFLSLTIPGACVRASSLSDYNFFVVLTLGASFVIAVSLCNFSFVRVVFVVFVMYCCFFLDELLLCVASLCLEYSVFLLCCFIWLRCHNLVR